MYCEGLNNQTNVNSTNISRGILRRRDKDIGARKRSPSSGKDIMFALREAIGSPYGYSKRRSSPLKREKAPLPLRDVFGRQRCQDACLALFRFNQTANQPVRTIPHSSRNRLGQRLF